MDRYYEMLLEKYRQPAIMVHRPYPPVGLPPTNSHLGGRPKLPAQLDWPRTSAGVPLHFLAQIDCAEPPPNNDVLPNSGVLFFFARIDEELLWGESGNPADDCRVLFGPIGSHETAPPADLPQALGIAGPVIDFALAEDGPIQLYPQWPVTFHEINSWPDASALPELVADRKAYAQFVKAARVAEELRVLGQPVKASYVADWRKEMMLASQAKLALPQSSSAEPFPQVWVIIDRISRHILRSAAANMWRAPPQQGPDPALLLEIRSAAEIWVAAARDHGLDEKPGADTSRRFSAWLMELGDLAFFRQKVAAAVNKGTESAIQHAASAPKAAALIPAIYYQEMGERRSGRYHQMLGNTGSTQTARSVERDEVLLLQLKSDYGVNFMFCDVGEAEFWINKDDLAARRFDKVFATTCGG